MNSDLTSSFLFFLFRKKHFILFTLFVFLCCYVKAQVNNSGNLYVAGNTYINTTFTNTSTGVYQNDGYVYLTGNFVNSAPSITEGVGTTSFNGTGLQKIGGTQPSTFHNVVLSNTSGVQLKINAIMGGIISTINGSLYFNDYALAMGGKINTAYTNTSAFNVTNKSDLILYGDASSGNKLYFDSSANLLHDLTINNGGTGTLGNALNITPGSSFGTVTATGTFDANNFLTLKSDSNGTARVANSAGVINNFVTVERFVHGRRAWRFMAAPVNNDTLNIRTAWQEGANNYDLIYANHQDPHPGFGTEITEDNDPTKGFDVNTTYNPSLYDFDQTTQNWSPIPPTKTTLLNNYSAYYMFIRGSRAVNLAYATSAPTDNTIIRETGRLNNGSYTKTFTGTTGDDIFVGNPYASSINLATVLGNSTGVNTNKFYVWDPAINGSYGVGGYVTYDNGIMVPATPNYPSATTVIQGEQGFFLETNASTASINFTQNCKLASEKNVFGTINKDYLIYANLMTPSSDSLLLVDGAGAIFNNRFSAEIDDDDAVKFYNIKENIDFVRNDYEMAVETRPMPVLTDTLFLRMSYLRANQPYALSLNAQGATMANIQGYLVDNLMNTQTTLHTTDTTLYNFTPTADTATYMRRFMIVYHFKKVATGVPTASFTKAVTLNMVSIYPNPVTESTFQLTLDNMAKDDYTLNVYDNSGHLLFTRKLSHSGGSNNYSIKLDDRITSGTYNVNILGSNEKLIATTKLVVSK